jgi:LuxR family maltose regulon positive regulatory protein
LPKFSVSGYNYFTSSAAKGYLRFIDRWSTGSTAGVIPLLTTKLFIPPRRPHDSVVDRSRLADRLNATNGQRLTLISAPAGFGKTTLLSEWIPYSECCVPWLSLDANDNDPPRFWAYVIAALQTLRPDLGANALALLDSPQTPPIESILTLLLNDVAAFTDRFVLVLDDYHLVETPAIHTALTFLLDHLPPQMQLIITTRSDPPLPLARWRARRQLTEIRAADLRFTPAEAAAFLNRVMGLNLSGDEIAALETRTEGWIVGLQLAALSMQGREDVGGFIRSFTGSHAYIIDYLAEEVVQRQAADVQAFLLQTSILDRMCGSLCDAVLEQTDSQSTLESLQHSNLFVIPLDDERRWFRYHHLFAEVLRARLSATQPEIVHALHQRASEWYEQHGLLTEAIPHAFAAGSIDLAAHLIEQHGLSLIARGESRLVLDWLEMLPTRLFQERPMLCIAHGTVLALTNRREAAEVRLQEAERAIALLSSDDRARHLRGIVLTIRAELTRYVGDTIGSVTFAREAAALLPTTDRASRQRASDYAALDFLVTGDMVHASEVYPAELIESTRAAGDLIGHFSAISTVGWAQLYQGRLRKAAQLFQTGLAEAAAAGLQHFFADMFYHIGLGSIQYEWNQLDEAERHLEQGLQLAHGVSVEANGALVGSTGLARIRQARGDAAGALELLDRFAQVAHQRHFAAPLIARGEAMRARVLLMQGEIDAVWHWVEASGLTIDAELSYPLENRHLTLARALIIRQNSPAALHLLTRLLRDAELKARFNSVIEIQAVRALALQAEDDTSAALSALEHALTLAEPEGYVRVFVDEGDLMRCLIADFRLSIAERSPRLGSYVDKLLAAFPAARSTSRDPQISRPPSASANLVEPLSERELEVLRLIADGLSNHEIADKLIIGLGTVKTHINNIFGKLGVKNRTQAVTRARELNLL